MNKKLKIIIFFLCVIFFAFIIRFFINSDTEFTDDANIESHVIPIITKLSGNISNIYVNDNQKVQKGDCLVEIDSKDYELKLDIAKANFLSLEAIEKNAVLNAKRLLDVGNQTATQKEIDKAISEQNSSLANLEAAKAQIALCEKDLNDIKILAPSDGIVTMKSAEEGKYAKQNEQLLTIVTNERWVVANFKERQITNMKKGQKAEISIDAYPDLKIKGHIESIQAGTGSRFSIFPPQNATGNFVKIVQRVPVKITIDSILPSDIVIGPGFSVEVKVLTK